MRLGQLLLLCFLVGMNASAQPGKRPTEQERFLLESSSSPKMWKLFNQLGVAHKREIYLGYLNPYFLWGDFDGDSIQDYVVQLISRQGAADWQIAVIFGNGNFSLIQRDSLCKFPGPSAWYVVPKQKERLPKSAFDDRQPPVLVGDAIMMVQVEASSALVYWNGKRFVSYWYDD